MYYFSGITYGKYLQDLTHELTFIHDLYKGVPVVIFADNASFV